MGKDICFEQRAMNPMCSLQLGVLFLSNVLKHQGHTDLAKAWPVVVCLWSLLME
jgi:hypothetical protein